MEGVGVRAEEVEEAVVVGERGGEGGAFFCVSSSKQR